VLVVRRDTSTFFISDLTTTGGIRECHEDRLLGRLLVLSVKSIFAIFLAVVSTGSARHCLG